jgi:hypothetical protein
MFKISKKLSFVVLFVLFLQTFHSKANDSQNFYEKFMKTWFDQFQFLAKGETVFETQLRKSLEPQPQSDDRENLFEELMRNWCKAQLQFDSDFLRILEMLQEGFEMYPKPLTRDDLVYWVLADETTRSLLLGSVVSEIGSTNVEPDQIDKRFAGALNFIERPWKRPTSTLSEKDLRKLRENYFSEADELKLRRTYFLNINFYNWLKTHNWMIKSLKSSQIFSWKNDVMEDCLIALADVLFLSSHVASDDYLEKVKTQLGKEKVEKQNYKDFLSSVLFQEALLPFALKKYNDLTKP